MAANLHPISPESAAANALTHYPPPISLSSPILASALALPPKPVIVYAIYVPSSSASDPLDTLELARRAVVKLAQPSLVASLLPTVLIDKDTLRLYVFAVDSLAEAQTTGSRAALGALTLDGMSLVESATFTPADIYPCSLTCASQRRPCPSCLSPDSFPATSSPSTSSNPSAPSSRHLPRIPLRPVLARFFCAVRERVIDDLCKDEENAGQGKERRRRMCRLKNGFVIFSPSAGARISEAVDWGTGWEHNSLNRPLVHCMLHLYLTSTRILIHPFLRATHFLPLCPSPNPNVSQAPCRACPLESCTPITLLPYGTPAYYLTAYTGPTAALTQLFRASLTGLGCAALLPHFTSVLDRASSSSACHSEDPASNTTGAYILAWVPVQNRQGEPKGLTLIWPTALTLRFVPGAPVPHARTRLASLPVLPVQLMPSPPLPSASASVAASVAGTPPPEVLRPPPLPPALTRRSCLTSAARRVLRTCSLGGVGGIEVPCAPDVNIVAKEAEGYVDAVAKDRERERERLRREREAASVAGTSQTETPPAQISMQQQSQLADSLPEPEPFYPSPSPSAGSMPPAIALRTGPPPALPPMLGTGSVTPAPAAMEGPPTNETTPSIDAFASAPLPQSTPIAGHDAFADLDVWAHDPNGWLPGSGSFMNMPGGDGDVGLDMHMGMDMDMGMDAITSSGAGAGAWGSAGDVAKMDVDSGMDEVFTDADFDFWNAKPTGVGAGPSPVTAPQAAAMAAAIVQNQPLYGGEMQLSGPGPPSVPPHASPWVPSVVAEGFTSAVDGGMGVDSFPEGATLPSPALFPPSPVRTPDSHIEPAVISAATPLAPGPRSVNSSRTHMSGMDCIAKLDAPLGPSVFDPLPFASVHRIADGKYTAGKFALPSPPDEEDRTRPIPFLSSNASEKDGWRMRYDAVTDPRVNVVRKLIGVKRKSFDQGARDWRTTPSPAWTRASEEWTANVIQDVDDDQEDDSKSDAESEDEDPWAEEDEPTPPPGTRPSTPAPSYLPLGPTLLHTQFQHAQLLPLSTALKPAEVALSPPSTASTSAPVSVPTPVSPAAILGAAMEKSKSLEAAAHILAKEVVESCVWGDAWRANAPDYISECRTSSDVWQADVKQVARAIEGVPSLQGPFKLGEVFGEEVQGTPQDAAMEALEAPMISVGKSDSIIQVLPTAIRFWEKLGLLPRAGKKDVIAFVLFEDLDEARQILVERWLTFVSSVYTAHNLGSHTAGRSSSCVRDGLVPLKFDSFRKTLATFVAGLPAVKAHYVFYIATPPSIISLTSTTLRQVFSAVKRAQKTYAEAQILFQFLPAHLVYSAQYPPSHGCGQLLYMGSVYDRILRPVDRVMSRRFFEHGERIRAFFQEPAFTIARPLRTKVHLVKEAPARTLDVVDRYTLLHVGYRISTCGRWIFAACIDQRGEAHDLGVWLASSEALETHAVQQLWTFAVNFAKRASVEWRIAFAKLGTMGPAELDAWINHLETVVPECPELPAIHVSLLSADPDASWTFIAPLAVARRPTSPNRSSSKNPTGSFFADISSSTHCLFYPPHMTLVEGNDDLGTALSHIPDTADAALHPSRSLPLRPINTTTLIRVPSSTDYTSISMLHIHLLRTFRSLHSSLTTPDEQTHQDITRNYYELTVLAQLRHLKANPILPFHLGALDIMDMALSGSFAAEC